MRHLTARSICRPLEQLSTFQGAGIIGRRYIRIEPTPSSATLAIDAELASSPDARFEVLGAPFSLLSVALSPSQNLYTRRGTLVAFSGKAEDAISTLSVLGPFRRAALGIPFLYQRISSTSPTTALISTKSPYTSFSVVHLDGRLDWMVTNRKGLLAWTGHTLNVKPSVNTRLSLANWGNTQVTGRGLIALAGEGQVYQISLKTGEEYVVYPSNVLAYTIMPSPPQPYRFKSTSLRLQVPLSLGRFFPDTQFFRSLSSTGTWKALAKFFYTLRTWTRRSIWGDRLFLRFQGPTTILLQSRASRINEVLTTKDLNEIADTPAGSVSSALYQGVRKDAGHGSSGTTQSAPSTKVSYATVKEGKAEFEKA